MTDRRTYRPDLLARLGAYPFAVLLLLAAVAVPSVVQADVDEDTFKEEQQIDRTTRQIERSERGEGKARANLKTLRHQEQDLKFRKRTGDPFQSRRAIRNDLRSNSATQAWQKREARRYDFQVRQGERRLRSQTRDLRRTRSR